MESTTHEYAGSRIASGGNTNVTAGEHDLTVKGSTIEGKDMSLTAKENVRLEAGENTSITTTENKFSSASIGASFTPQGLSDISINANKANGNSKESVTAYSPALVAAENNLSLTSGKDMDIIGSRAQGDRITAKIGGNLNIETLQEKENFTEENKSAGFGGSWSMNPVTQRLSKPTFSRDLSKGTIDSLYRSARDQAGFFAGSGGFDIYVEKNTDLKGGLIASEASSDKNKLSTGTFSFSDLHNEAEYSAKDMGSSAQIKPTLVQIKEKNPDGSENKTLKVVQALHPTPSIPTVVQGSANSTTKSAVAPGIIDIRENPTQDISSLSRDTANALNELGRIFDKKSVEEQKELVNVFREEAFRLLHDLPDDGSERKVILHAFVGGLISQFAGAGFASGAAGAGLNEALINNLKGLDPTIAQIASGVLGAAAAKIVNGDATAGAIAAASGTKWNSLLTESDFVRECIRDDDLVKNLPEGTCNLIAVSGGDAVSLSGMVMVFNVEGTPVYSSYNIEGGLSAFVGAYTMGRGYLEDPQGNIVTDPEILKEQLTGFSMGWSAGFGLEHGQSTNVNGYSFIYNAISSTPTISLSAGWVFYEGNQKDF
ncbi:hypothetical protein HMPREF9081_1219 [Centipeda periodontii DSM 2778]|uniref:Uncharacterized protein n=1 Tax=Centipeda periodontii DSM 2778 TaxID=888060 RepID=F5RLR4_9FIRM|nr:hypothetical protein HMPREF9081_1219 [Centipeda periodontii DSM 2778]